MQGTRKGKKMNKYGRPKGEKKKRLEDKGGKEKSQIDEKIIFDTVVNEVAHSGALLSGILRRASTSLWGSKNLKEVRRRDEVSLIRDTGPLGDALWRDVKAL